MPRLNRTKKYRKRKIYRRKRRMIKRYRKKNPGNFLRLGHNMTFPKYMMVRQRFHLQGYIPAGVVSGYFDVDQNNVRHPLDGEAIQSLGTTQNFTSATNGTGVLLPGSSTVIQSQYYNELDAIYPVQRVIRSRLSVTMTPQALTDAVNIYVTPYIVSGGVAGPVNDTSQALGPRCKNKQCVANVASQSRNTIHYGISAASLFGVAKRAVYDEDDFISDNGPPLNKGSYRVFWTTTDAVALATPLPVHITLVQVTKFQNLINEYQT